jgi:hypothetical protein
MATTGHRAYCQKRRYSGTGVYRLRIGGLFVFVNRKERFGSRVSLGVAREERRCGVSEDFRSWRSSSPDISLTAFPLSTRPRPGRLSKLH